jgi:hypothetical protein
MGFGWLKRHGAFRKEIHAEKSLQTRNGVSGMSPSKHATHDE